jgi:PAS domain S-box-containing protein
MADADPAGPFVVHSDDRISNANGAFCALVGVDSHAEITGSSLLALVAEPYREPLTQHFEQLPRDAGPVGGLRLELLGTDGTTRDVLTRSSVCTQGGESRIQTSVFEVPSTTTDEELYETAAHRSPIGTTIADATVDDTPLCYVNDAFVDLTGYSRDDALGRNCRFLQGEATREDRVAELREAIAAEQPVTVDLRNYRTDGSLFWNRVTISPVENPAGRVTHFLGFQEDITEEKRHEAEKLLFETHSEISDQVMFITDEQGIIEYVNPAFERVTGYSAAEAIGNTPRILNSGQQDDGFYEELWETISAGESWEAELTNRMQSGELYQAHQRIVPITDDQDEITHFIAIEPDVTDRHLTEQVLDVLNRILRHNLRTSLNVIEGYTDLLETDLDEAERTAAIQTIRDRTTELQQISDHTTTLRDILAGEDGASSLPLSTIEEIVDQSRQRYPDAVIETSILTSLDREIKNGDVFQIAFEEAIDNAVIHADREPPRIDITVDQSADNTRAVIDVADNGPGIPETEWEVIKTGEETPLQHADSIGLWLLYWSVSVLGGTVDYTRNEPRGTVLSIQVPLTSEST